MVAVDVVMRMGELRDTDRTLPEINRRPPIIALAMEVSAGACAAFSITMRLSPRKIIEWVFTTKMSWLFVPVWTTSPGLMLVFRVAG